MQIEDQANDVNISTILGSMTIFLNYGSNFLAAYSYFFMIKM